MRPLLLPEHMLAWGEAQVANGRAASVGTYVAQLIMADRQRQENQAFVCQAVEEARASGISMRDPDDVIADYLPLPHIPEGDLLRRAIREGRESGTSLAAMEGILTRSLNSHARRAA